jgi:hypothetical protein
MFAPPERTLFSFMLCLLGAWKYAFLLTLTEINIHAGDIMNTFPFVVPAGMKICVLVCD